MKVYCVMECDLRTGETVLKSVFSTFKKAMDLCKLSANERVKRYSQTREVEERKDGYIVWYKEEGDIEKDDNSNMMCMYYVKEKLVIN